MTRGNKRNVKSAKLFVDQSEYDTIRRLQAKADKSLFVRQTSETRNTFEEFLLHFFKDNYVLLRQGLQTEQYERSEVG